MGDSKYYSEICGNQITIKSDDADYEVQLNDMLIVTTGDEYEAEMIAESLDICLSVLNAQGLLRNFNDISKK